MYKALKIIVNGRVQGVGFRPFVYSLAKKYELAGTIQNNVDSVVIHIEGEEEQVAKMVKKLETSSPKMAKINEIRVIEAPLVHYKHLIIAKSKETGSSFPWMAPDAAICEQCVEEMKDPSNRRFQYPFINCTQCGPRYTIIEKLPYDRANTMMNEFIMCPECEKEYQDLDNRRHHAQPICCSKCGPKITLYNRNRDSLATNQQAIMQTVDLLKQGKIIAIKGIGGYHLACDAKQEKAVELVRLRKQRPQRPLAIMVKSLATARTLCHISKHEEEWLTSSERPIVILQRKKDARLPINLSPGLSTLGIMLPYTPLHHLLFENDRLEYIVLTSANPSGLPIQYKEDSFHHLIKLSDYVLTYDRKIYVPTDDSVVQCNEENTLFLRRARGFVPDPIKTNTNVERIIALGGNQKNTFAIGKQHHIVLGPHIGDLDHEEMICSFEDHLHYYKKWLDIEEKYVAIDQHPLYTATSIAKKLQGKVIPIQHHHAHHVSCMEDNELKEPCLGIILDGTGYGEDGHIWGFECLYADAYSFERLGHLQYTPLPGGDRAVREPWRTAVGMIFHYWPQEGKELAAKLFPDKEKEITIIGKMVHHQMNTPIAGTCGRLFDAISAILGICSLSTYEGEAAIKLADYMSIPYDATVEEMYPYHLKTNKHNMLELDLSPMIYQIIQDKLKQTPIADIIQTFHHTIVSCCVQMILTIIKNRPELNRTVVLSGGSFQNIYLAREIKKRLQREDFSVYTHKQVPCHDGGLSFGQIIIAAHTIAQNNL